MSAWKDKQEHVGYYSLNKLKFLLLGSGRERLSSAFAGREGREEKLKEIQQASGCGIKSPLYLSLRDCFAESGFCYKQSRGSEVGSWVYCWGNQRLIIVGKRKRVA